VPKGRPAFESEILPKWERLTQETQLLFARLYLEGLSSGDFEPVFRQLVGEKAPLSANTILRLKERWGQEYEGWRRRPLDHAHFVYVWADGIYLGAGLEKQNSCLLTLLGAKADGTKELLAMEIGYRESKESWAEVLRSVRDRGLAAPLLLIADGSLGVWSALTDVFPTTRRQRCWNHRLMNVIDKLPRRLEGIVRSRLHQLYTAPTRTECEAGRDELAQWLREHAQLAAAETLLRDWEDFVTFYDFPKEHWFHIRTTNPIESVFASVRLRTNVAKRARNRENALFLVFKIVQRLSRGWRALNGDPTLMRALVAGVVFKDGVIQPQPPTPPTKEVMAA
jgi:transposase-like protein